ncbi:MAG: hypothetical protein CFE44_06135 [Burkholderiales bacterium PBB4]|nr:MAG: hypothetical protein CFE44_06135 [Burkholderiales bacterium PBB4]
MPPIDRTCDESLAAPYLRKDINLGTVLNLPRGSLGYRASLAEQLKMLKAAGHVAANSWGQYQEVLAAGMRATGMERITHTGQADEIARTHKALGMDATALHVGNSFETDPEMDALVASVLEASAKHGYPLYIETHRGTITQDIRRTVDMVQRFPDVRFNADMSHFYTGHELNYAGEFRQRLEWLAPVLERVRFMHGRISNTGCIQAPVHDTGIYVGHFAIMWQRCFEGFLRGAQPGDYLSFNAEILPLRIGTGEDTLWLHYAQQRPALPDDPLEGEPSDRYLEAQYLWDIASQAFADAQATVSQENTVK